jgi:Uma2 family endonuclease
MAKFHPGGVTLEELATHPDRDRSELVRGVLYVSEPPGGLHGSLAVRLAHRLDAHVEQHGLGTVLVEAGFVLSRHPDTVRGPDVSFVSRARLDPARVPAGFLPFAPDLAVEIVSPDDRWTALEAKVQEYLGAGTSLVWIVDPPGRRVVVHHRDRPIRVLSDSDSFEGEEVVPGFQMPVVALFGPRWA